jgi:hypothetical protein
MKIKLPAKETATRIVSVRFTPAEYQVILAKAHGVKPATLIRAVVIQVLKAGIEVN